MDICRVGISAEKLYKSDILPPDITLFANDSQVGIQCHKAILVLGNNYFPSLFDKNFIENKKSEICLQTFTYYWLDKFVKFIYCGKLHIDYEEFETILDYGCDFLQIDEFNEYWANLDYLPSLLEHYGYVKMLELTKTHKLAVYYNTVLDIVLKEYNVNELVELPLDIFKTIMATTLPIRYTPELEERCRSQNVDIGVNNGMCFGAISTICGIHDDYFSQTAAVHKTHIIGAAGSTVDTTYTEYQKLIVSTVIRGGITTTTVNDSRHDSMLREISNIVMREFGGYFTIFSPCEDVFVVVKQDESNIVRLCEIWRSQSTCDSSSMRWHSTDVVLPLDADNPLVAFSSSNIYIASVVYYPTVFDDCRIAYTAVSISDHTNRTTSDILDIPNWDSITRLTDVQYSNNMLYIMRVVFGNETTNYILVVNLETARLMHTIPLIRRHVLMTFGNTVYCAEINRETSMLKISEINELYYDKLVKLKTSYKVYRELHRFVIVGSYLSDTVTRAIL